MIEDNILEERERERKKLNKINSITVVMIKEKVYCVVFRMNEVFIRNKFHHLEILLDHK